MKADEVSNPPKKDSQEITADKPSKTLHMDEFSFEGEKITKPTEQVKGFGKVLSGSQFVISMVLVLVTGLIFLGGIYYFVNQDFLFKGPKYKDPVTTAPISLYLEVGAPETDSLSQANTVIVSGKTIPDAVVAIISPSENIIFSANGLGEFSKIFPLTAGLNPISIYVYDNKGNSKTENISVYYTSDPVEKEAK